MSVEKIQVKDKPLEKMTVKDLKEIAKEIPEISGVHGMKKDELIVAIKEAKGIQDEPLKKSVASAASAGSASVSEIKTMIKALKAQRQAALAASDKKMATIYRRRISRLKKKTRQVAA